MSHAAHPRGLKRPTTFAVRSHDITIENLEDGRWRASIDGKSFATFCSESRARTAGRNEVRRRELWPVSAEPST